MITAADETLLHVLQKAGYWITHQDKLINERQLKMVNKLIDNFEGKLNTSKWAKICKCSPDTALRDMQDLLKKEMLEKEPGGRRSTSCAIKHV